MNRVSVIDSHTGGEPTRVVISGGPDLGSGSTAERLKVFRDRHDSFRSAIVNEPRGSDVLVGALLCPAADRSCSAGVIFFNNVGCLGMCGHGTIGLMVTLAHLGRIGPGAHRLETSVGIVSAVLNADGSVSVENVNSHRKAAGVTISLKDDSGTSETGFPSEVTGDVAYGGNWFYLVHDHAQKLDRSRIDQLTSFTWRIRQAINSQGFPEVDHVELFGPPAGQSAQSRNFVLCPGKAYDRSPCGTGTSARLACLAADGKLGEGQDYVVESIIGSRFVGRFKWVDQARGVIAPSITGNAHIISEATLILDERDPYCHGIRQI
jgi:4-hydroxyproline epimerase